MNKSITLQKGMKGKVERRLFDTAKLNIAKYAVAQGADASYVERLLDLAAKPMFKENALWRLFHKLFDVDFQIPVLFGFWTTKAISRNLITNVGLAIAAGQLNGVTTAPVTAIALGTGTTAANASDTALETEITDSGGQRGAATTSRVTTTVTNDTSQWVKTFNFTGTKAVTEEGLLDNNTSGGNLLARQVFSAVNVVNGDSLQITHKVAHTTS